MLSVFVLTPLSFICLLTVAMEYSGLRNEGPSVENLEPQIFPINPGVGQNIAIHASLTTRNFFLSNFYLSGLFTFVPKYLPTFSLR